MLRTKPISEAIGLHVFTDSGDLFGEIEDAVLIKNKVDAWKVRATRESFLTKALAGAKGVIVPHQLVRAIGDIVIVSKAAAPNQRDEE